ncbi:MAG: hypothetical protein ACLFR1_07390 [Spirochaetia bacterium]
MITLEKRNDIVPVCPSCKKETKTIGFQEIKSGFGKRYIYTCPHCNAIVGVSHRKGFWMG